MPSTAFQTEMARLQDAHPVTKVEFISTTGVVTDISTYYASGASFDQIKERAPDEIQAGDFDIVLFNHDNYFSEYVSTSLIYNTQYHGARIRVSLGFVLPDGTSEYTVVAIGYVDQIITDGSTATVTFRCRDLIRRILDEKLHPHPAVEIAVAAAGNTGNGIVSEIATKPFKTVTEDWTLTCTNGGADGAATFSVVGSVTGSVGTATSGTEFSTGTGAGGIKFLISGGGTNWVVGDVFTFSTKQYPQWTAVNAAKIIWAVLTGYNWDTNTQETWSALVLNLDHTQSSSNTDIDYDSFVTTINALADIGSFIVTGYAAYDEGCVDFIQNLILLFLGSMFTGGDGRIKIKTYIPTFTSSTATEFSDANQVRILGYTRTVDEVINYISVHYKKTNVWEFSTEDVNYDGNYVATDDASLAKYNYLTEGFSIRWYATNGVHVQDFADKLVGKYAEPPLNIDLETGLDALLTDIGDIVSVTDTKYGLSGVEGEVSHITKRLDDRPARIAMRVRRDSDIQLLFGFLASEVDEGDGLSPQSTSYDTASDTDKLFCYMGQTGQASPDYRMF